MAANQGGVEIVTIEALMAQNAELRRQLNVLPILASLDAAHFSCSSEYSAEYAVSRVCLNQPSAWHPAGGSNYSNQWVEADLGADYVLSRMEVHGRGSNGNYVTRFEIHYRGEGNGDYSILSPLEGDTFHQFKGVNNEHAQVVLSNFRPFRARYVRFVPREYNAGPAFKWELHGYPVVPQIIPAN